MTIQSGDVNLFFKLLPSLICWFKVFKRSNYTNSCELSLANWLYWKFSNHPIIPYLELYFRACSEERGETAIHNLMTHFRECNFQGSNISQRWKESSTAKILFQKLNIPRSHKHDGTKIYQMEDLPPEFIVVEKEFF